MSSQGGRQGRACELADIIALRLSEKSRFDIKGCRCDEFVLLALSSPRSLESCQDLRRVPLAYGGSKNDRFVSGDLCTEMDRTA